MIERRESEMIAQDLRNQAKQRQANGQTHRQTNGQTPATPKSAERRTTANTSYNE